ncbi:radical SAM protein [Candidatus Fermentibacterales bacterium]|nr:radical SAM protein [Candidatus Fermentibacterales bacterium]
MASIIPRPQSSTNNDGTDREECVIESVGRSGYIPSMGSFSSVLQPLRSASDYLLRRPVPSSMPNIVLIEPTNACNLHCRMCSRDYGQRETGFMDPAFFSGLIDQVELFRPLVITLHLAGEPLMHPELPGMVRIAAGKGLHVLFSTNGALLTPEVSRELIEAGLKAIRIDFTTDVERFSFARAGLDWEQVRRNIESMIELRNSMGLHFPLVRLHVLVFRERERERERGHLEAQGPLLLAS